MDKFIPQNNKEYIVTDQCFWKPLTEKEQQEYNPYAKDRLPHGITLVDTETGTTVNLLSGSIIKVIKNHERYLDRGTPAEDGTLVPTT